MQSDLIKLALIGPGGVGKTALTIKFVHGIFLEKYDPTIEDSYRKMIQISEEQHVMTEILDTAGAEQFASMRDMYIKLANGFLLVYSIVSVATFEEMAALHRQIYRVKEMEPDTGKIPIVLVGNKADLTEHRKVTMEQGAALAAKCQCSFLETSAKTSLNLERLFGDMARRVIYSASTDADGGSKPKKKATRAGLCGLL